MALMAMVASGAQDVPECPSPSLLQGKISCTQDNVKLEGGVISKVCDVLQNMVLIVDDVSASTFNDAVERVCVHGQGQQHNEWQLIDSLACEDLYGQMSIVAGLYGRPVCQVGSSLYMPLCLAPFPSPAGLPLVRLRDGLIRVEVRLKKRCVWRLRADHAYIDKPFLQTKRHVSYVYQSHHQTIPATYEGRNKIRLSCQLSVPLVYLWGDISCIHTVEVWLNDRLYRSVSVADLRYEQRALDYPNNALFWIFSQDLMFNLRSSLIMQERRAVNMSRIERADLILVCEKPSGAIHVGSLNQNRMICSQGLMQMMYARDEPKVHPLQ